MRRRAARFCPLLSGVRSSHGYPSNTGDGVRMGS